MEIKGRQLDFIEESHTYFVDGVKVESITQLLGRVFPNKYKGIHSEVLRRASERGTQVHRAIEAYCKGFDDGSEEVRNFNFLRKHYGFVPLENELPIILDFGGKTYAGTLDLLSKMDNQIVLMDVKTTSTLDKNYLGYQLNLYKIGAEQSYGYKIDQLFGIHLRDDIRKLVKIPIVTEEQLYESMKDIL